MGKQPLFHTANLSQRPDMIRLAISHQHQRVELAKGLGDGVLYADKIVDDRLCFAIIALAFCDDDIELGTGQQGQGLAITPESGILQQIMSDLLRIVLAVSLAEGIGL